MSVDSASAGDQPDLLEPARGPWIGQRSFAVLLCLCLAVMSAAWLRILWGSDGRLDGMGRLLGADFAAFWGVGKAVLAGEPAAPYQLEWFNAHLRRVFGPDMFQLAWSYPPMIYFVVAPLAMLPYGAALLVWLGSAYAGLVLAARGILGAAARHPMFWLAVLAYPGIYGNGLQGQSGFLSAALLGGALLYLDRRPAISGLLFALLAFKPQFGILVPLALLAGKRWQTIFSAGAFGVAILALTILAFGWEVWPAFFAGLAETRHHLLDEGKVGYHIIQSPFGMLRLYGVAAPLAYAGQLAVTGIAALLIWRLWSGPADIRLKCAALVAASLMASPYCIDYDLVVLAPAIAFLVSHGLEKGFGPWGHTIMALAFVMPPLARFSSFFLGFPLGFVAAALLFTFSLSSAVREAGGQRNSSPTT